MNEFGIHIVVRLCAQSVYADHIGYPDERIQELNKYTANLCDMPFPCTIL